MPTHLSTFSTTRPSRWLGRLGLLLLLALPLLCSGQGWLQNFSDAKQRAEATGKPLLLFFSALEWSAPSVELETEVFRSAAFRELADRFVLVKVDFAQGSTQPEWLSAQNSGLRRQFRVTVIPEVVIAEASGAVVARRAEYSSGEAAEFLVFLRDALSSRR